MMCCITFDISLLYNRFTFHFIKDINMSLVSFRNFTTFTIRRYQSLCQRHSYGAVLFTSVHESLHTTLQLANTSDRYSAYKRFSLSRFILFNAKQFICHSRRTHAIHSTPPSITNHSLLFFSCNDKIIF